MRETLSLSPAAVIKWLHRHEIRQLLCHDRRREKIMQDHNLEAEGLKKGDIMGNPQRMALALQLQNPLPTAPKL